MTSSAESGFRRATDDEHAMSSILTGSRLALQPL
jgi:hypothetical protein